MPLAPDAPELRAVAPLLVGGRLVGACTVVRQRGLAYALVSAELTRAAGPPPCVATALDGTTSLELGPRAHGTSSAVDCYPLTGAWPSAELQPVDAACVSAIRHIHDGSPTLVAFAQRGSHFERLQIAVTVGMWTYVSSRPRTDDADCFEATLRDPLPRDTCWEGAPIIVKTPALRVVGLPPRTIICAVATKLGYTRTEPPPLASLRAIGLPR